MMRIFLLLLFASLGNAFTGVFKPGLQIIHSDSTYWNGYLSLRLMDNPRLGPVRTDFAWVLSPTAGDPALCGPENSQSNFRITDLRARLYPEEWNDEENFSILQNIDRLNFQVRAARVRLTLGRQAIFWGVSKSVSPTDFIAPFPYGAINKDYRAGVDAVRAVYPIGVMSEIESGWVFGEEAELEKSGFWLKTRLYALNTDISILAAGFRENRLLGASINRPLGGAVAWIESAVAKPDNDKSYWRISTGLERSFRNNTLYSFLEYHYNSPGTSTMENYQINSSTAAYTNGGVYLRAKHYLAAGLSITVTPLLTFNTNALINMDDQSGQTSLNADHSLSDNWALNSGISSGFGTEESEFGNFHSLFYLILSVYF